MVKNNDTTTIGVKVPVKAAFDEYQAKLGAASASEALTALLEHADDDAMTGAFDDVEVAGVKEVKTILTRAARQMVVVLQHRYDEQESLLESKRQLIDTLEEGAAHFDEVREKLTAQIAERDATIADLTAKAESVDALTEAMREAEEAASKREEAQAKRFDDVMAMLKAQIERYESELDEAKAKVERLATERDGLKAEVERLTAELDQARATQSQN